jgi:plastocyanin
MSFPGTYNINYYYGDTLEFRVFPKNSSGEPFDLNTFTTARFTIAENRNTPVENQIVCFANISSDNTNVFCAIRPEDSVNLVPGTQYVYDVEVSKSAEPYDIVYTLLTGNVTITNDVTRPDSGQIIPVPNNPTNLVIDNIGTTAVDVSWTAPSGGGPLTLYKLAAIPFTTDTETLENAIDSSTLALSSDNTSYTFTGLDSDTDYSFIIIGSGPSGDASLSTLLTNDSAVRTLVIINPPNAPVIQSITELSESIEIVFTQSGDGGAEITNYKYTVDGSTYLAFDPAQFKPTAVTFAVTVQSVEGSNKYFIDGVDRPNLTLYKGVTYTFDQSDASNATHQIYLSETEDGTHGGGTEYITEVAYTGTAGTDGSLVFEVPENAPATLYYVCVNHSGMGVPATISVEDFSLLISGLDNGTTYPVAIKAVNSVGDSDPSNILTATPNPTVAEAPVITGVVGVETDLEVSFTQGDNGGSAITNYKYSLNGNSYVALDPEQTSSPLVIAVQDTEISYAVKIIAVNSVGDSLESNEEVGVFPPAQQEPDFFVTSSGTSEYLIDGVGNDTITLVRGETYIFNISAAGHPFWIQTVPAPYSSGDVYSDGVTNNGAENGEIVWTVSQEAPNTLYYVCQFHTAMTGTINIVDGGS